MKKMAYPKAQDADILLILEGTYPFVAGGVSNWVYELIRTFSEYRFAAVFLGTREKDYDAPCYPLPDNLVHLDVYYLFEDKPDLPHQYTYKKIDTNTQKKVVCLHEQFMDYFSDEFDLQPLLELLQDEHLLNEELFLRSTSSWEFLLQQYREKHPEQSFFDYFWGVRNLHRPFWVFNTIIQNIPRIKILHSASTGYAGFLGALLHKKYNIPFILSEHGIYTKERWIDLMRNYFFQHVLQEHKSFEEEQGLLNVWLRFFSVLGKMTYNTSNPIISVSESYRERQIKDGALRDKTLVIPYGIDFNHYRFLGKKKPDSKRPVLALIGRVVAIKDVKTFIRACALIINQKPETEAWIVGSLHEDEEYVSICKNLIQILGIEKHVKFLGEQNVMDIYPKIDLLLLTSISEASPFVILECLAVGVPVVATNVGACDELIYGKTPDDQALGPGGIIVEMANPRAVADAALQLLEDDTRWFNAQQSGYQRVQRYYSMDLFVKNYNEIYQGTLNSRLLSWQG